MLTFLITPFAATGLFRMFDAVSTVLPFFVALVIAAWLWRVHRGLRPVAVGMAAASVAHAAFLAWLFLTWGGSASRSWSTRSTGFRFGCGTAVVTVELDSAHRSLRRS